MKLVKQKILYFSEGTSDKVYEVDICENQELFYVNFRYGKRDATLREGTKTIFPVSYDEALKVFNKLIESKEKKGYSENKDPEIEVQAPVVAVHTAREETILKYLKQAINHTYTRNWRVSRIILRAANLNMHDAASLIATFLKSDDEFEKHNAINALATFKNRDYNHQVLDVFKTDKFDTISGRAACAFLLKFGNDSDKTFIRNTVAGNVSEDAINSLAVTMLHGDSKNAATLYHAYLYSYDNESLREKVYAMIEQIPFKANTFKSIRYIYRATQFANDMEFFALLSKRFALSKPGYTSEYFHDENGWTSVDTEKQKKNPAIAFSRKTKSYFNTATYKKLYNLSQKDINVYINCATKILCALNDKEDRAFEETQYSLSYNEATRRYENEKRYYPRYHNYTALMYILYGNSTRFSRQKNKWYYVEEKTDTTSREEVLSNIWDQKPNEVLQILSNSKSEIAINFSLPILKDNLHFLDTISSEQLTKLAGHHHTGVIELISGFLERKYATEQPEEGIVLSLLSSQNETSVKLGLRWLEKHKDAYFKNSDFAIHLLLTNELKVASFLHNMYLTGSSYQGKIDIGKLESLFSQNSDFSEDFLVAVTGLIGNTSFGKLFSEIPARKIMELSSSAIVSNKLFAVNLAKHNSTPPYELFKDSFKAYITSDNELLRKAGIEILGHFSNDFLLKNKQEIVGFCFSEYKEVREAIQPTIERLIQLDQVFKKGLLNQLLQTLTEPENYDGLHKNSYELLTTYFKKSLTSLSEEQIFNLILSKEEFAQNLATPLFESRIQLSSLSMPQLVLLTTSHVFSIRKKVQSYFEGNTSRVNYELEQVLLVFNTEWQDVIDWARIYLDEHIKPSNWTVELLLYTCDHVNKDVQAFGMKTITKHFSNEKGLPLLEKLQEHPTKEIQFFVTNYLTTYASDKVSVILKLENYFRTSLFNINTNRATKTRIYSFLETEAVKNEQVALMTVKIISSILDTKIIKDRSKNIDILITIASHYPELKVPLTINEVNNEI